MLAAQTTAAAAGGVVDGCRRLPLPVVSCETLCVCDAEGGSPWHVAWRAPNTASLDDGLLAQAPHSLVPSPFPLTPPAPCRLTFYFGLNLLAKYDPPKRWQLRVATASRLLGCLDVVTQVDLGEE